MSHTTASTATPITFAPLAPGRTTGSSAVRLTRRGRLTVFLSVLFVLMVAAVALGAQSQASDEAGAPVATRTVTVQPGDTLWAIASEVADDGSTQAAVIQIQQLNALPSVSLSAGQRIEVPVG